MAPLPSKGGIHAGGYRNVETHADGSRAFRLPLHGHRFPDDLPSVRDSFVGRGFGPMMRIAFWLEYCEDGQIEAIVVKASPEISSGKEAREWLLREVGIRAFSVYELNFYPRSPDNFDMGDYEVTILHDHRALLTWEAIK
jgi:hypothetical protein